MDAKTRDTLETLDIAARQIAKLFAKKYYGYGIDRIYCIANDPIDAWFIGNFLWRFGDMVTALQRNVDKDVLMEWHEHKLVNMAAGRPVIRLDLWIKGLRTDDLTKERQQ